MVGKKALMRKSALPTKVKIASLSQMVVKRCMNQVGGGARSLRTEHISKLMFKMRASGYDTAGRVEVLLAGLKGFKRMEEEQANSGRPINRPGWMGSRGRRLRKLI